MGPTPPPDLATGFLVAFLSGVDFFWTFLVSAGGCLGSAALGVAVDAVAACGGQPPSSHMSSRPVRPVPAETLVASSMLVGLAACSSWGLLLARSELPPVSSSNTAAPIATVLGRGPLMIHEGFFFTVLRCSSCSDPPVSGRITRLGFCTKGNAISPPKSNSTIN